jgi:hypothetical protein
MEQDCLLAAALVSDKHEEKRMADDNTVSRSLHDLGLAGGTVLLAANKGRVAGQQGVAEATAVKTGLTVLALGATAWARVLGAKLNQAGEVPVEGGSDRSGDTPEDVAKAQQQLKFLQWASPS